MRKTGRSLSTFIGGAILLLVVGCHPGLVNEDCDLHDRLSSGTFLSKTICKVGNWF